MTATTQRLCELLNRDNFPPLTPEVACEIANALPELLAWSDRAKELLGESLMVAQLSAVATHTALPNTSTALRIHVGELQAFLAEK